MARNSTDIANAIEQVNGIVTAQNVALQSVKTALEGKAAGSGSGVPDYTLLSESEGLAESVSVLEFTGLSGYNDFILTYIAPKAVAASGVILYINDRQVSGELGNYFVHPSTSRNGILQIRCNLKDGHYWIGGSAQTDNTMYNQDGIANVWGQTLLGGEELTSIKIALVNATSAIPAETTYKFYGRYLNA